MTRDNPQDRLLALREYTECYCDGTLSAEQTAELERWLRDDPWALDAFVLYMEVHSQIAWNARAFAEDAHGRSRDEGRGAGDEERGVAGSTAVEEGSGFGIRDSGFGIRSLENANPKSQIPNQQISCSESPTSLFYPPLSTLHSPLSTNFVGGPVFSYMVATVIVGMMLLGAWAYKITHYQQIVEKRSPSINQPEMQFVGQITGMKNCRWSDPQTETYPGASVPLGRRFALASGLMQITYDSGTKVILEGPCTYKVESRAGGYLSLGKLTAKVEGSGIRGQGSENTNPQISKSPNPSPLSSLPSPLFSVRTPTAVVTDLGTEFGVEVSENGDTTSHVFRGSVRVQVVGDKNLPSPDGRGVRDEGRVVQLNAGESARVEKKNDAGRPRLVTGNEVGTPPQFVRRVYEPPKVLDLLDVVAGGNGTGSHRERGIDPTTGIQDPSFVGSDRGGDRRYWPTAWHKLIDGVFVPDGGAGAVKLDSAGHTYGFPHTEGNAYGSIWARAADVNVGENLKNGRYWIYGIGRGGQFMPESRGLLALCANAGITFNLEAIRQTYPEVVPSRFCSVAGLGDARPLSPTAEGMADLWVFVDGRLEFHRAHLHPQDGAVNVDVELGPTDRFLTLVSTDSTADKSCDWVVFGDPVLEMTPQNRKEDRASKP